MFRLRFHIASRDSSEFFRTPATLLFLILGGFGLFRLVYCGFVNLSPQEAYYWVWSLHPALSYFDHPPMVAYSIAASKFFLGDTTLAIRIPAVLYGVGTSLLVFLLAHKIFNLQAGLVSALLLNLILSFCLTFLFTTPDSPLLFCWTLSMFFLWKAVMEKKTGFWYLAGIAFGLAMLSKYAAVFLAISTLVWLLSHKGLRPVLKTKEPYLSLCLAMLVFSPVLIWNFQNHWASFLFQSRDRAPSLISFSPKEFFAFLFSQMGVMTPLVFLGFLAAVSKGVRRNFSEGRPEEKFLLAYSLPLLAFFTVVATQDWVKINWLIPAYPPLLILMVGYYQMGLWRAPWVRRFYVSTLWALVLIPFLLLHLLPFIPGVEIPGTLDTLSGWPEVSARVTKIKKDFVSQGPVFVWAWNHKNAAELQFYLPNHEEVYAQNIVGEKALAYDFWFNPRSLAGKNAIFIWSDLDPLGQDRKDKIGKVFSSLQPLPSLEIYRGKKEVRKFHFYYCVNYKPFITSAGLAP